jgi:FAD/FMN-containing dehydrogenase
MSFRRGPGLQVKRHRKETDVQARPLATAALSIDDLRADIAGTVIAPDDAGYDVARQVHSAHIDRRPAVVVRAADTSDVAHVIAIARATGLELAVRSGGHSGPGFGTTDGGIVLDLSDLRGIAIDVQRETVWAGAGLTAGELTRAVAEQGLVIGFGDSGSVGIGGITLGGGIGYLVRKFGLTIDNLLAAEVVTADGRVVRASAEAHPDLFWAIRGGGGNFGVVTRFKYRLHRLPSVVAGTLVLPATPAVIAGFAAAAEAAPDELSTIVNVLPCPPLPTVARQFHGRPVLMAQLVYAGPTAAADDALAPFRALATPLADDLAEKPYADLFPDKGRGGRSTMAAAGRTLFRDAISETTAARILDLLASSDAPMHVIHFRVLGGAYRRVAPDATAYAHRASRIIVNTAASFATDAERATSEAWVDAVADELRTADTGAYVNFLGAEGEARVHDAYPGATWDRLVAIKRRYDPTNLFRLNQNLAPNAATSRELAG